MTAVNVINGHDLNTNDAKQLTGGIVFIDSTVTDYQSLLAGVVAGTEVVVLDCKRDGVEQIGEVLAGRRGVSNLHIVSHGSPGSVQLGTAELGFDTLERYAKVVQGWGDALVDRADILLYGCSVAAGEQGIAFVQQLSRLTGADVAASTNTTGSAALGGDWELEIKTGAIAAPLAFNTSVLESFNSVLQINVGGFVESVYFSGSATTFGSPTGFTIDPSTRTMFFADRNTTGVLRKLTPDRTLSTVTPDFTPSSGFYPYVATDIHFAGGFVYSSLSNGELAQINTSTGNSTILTTFPGFAAESGLDVNGNKIYVTDGEGGTNQLWVFDLSTNTASNKISNLPTSSYGLEFDAINNKVYFAANGSGFYVADLATGTFSLISSAPSGVGNFAIDPTGNFLYARVGNTVQRISVADGSYTTFQTGLVSDDLGDLAFGPSSTGSGTSLYVLSGESIIEVSGFNSPPSDNVFKITGLLDTGVNAIEHNTITGDDRGGIALSNSQVFYTGDNSTGRFALNNLSNGTSVGTVYDALVSNLATGQVFSLGNSSNKPIPNGGGTVTTLLGINGETGALSGSNITLSTPINVVGNTGSVGIFSGYNRVAIYTGSRVYNIDLLTGTVTDLGSMPNPKWQPSESWAIWGVAEFFDGALNLAYVRGGSYPGTTVERMRVPDGVTETVATFSNLSDMASFTVSPLNNRWYFQHEGNSQFRSGDETIGYANATFLIGNSTPPPNVAPVLDLNGAAPGINYAASFTEDAGTVAIVNSANLSVSDVDNSNLSSATVTLTNQLDGSAELLAANTAGTNISASYNAATGVLSLTGSDTVAHYQKVLQGVTYNNTSQIPNTTARSITFVVNDGKTNSAVATTTLDVTALNDAPIIAGAFIVSDINPAANDSNPLQLTNVNDELYFTASDPTNGAELWKSDGTAAGTVLIKDIRTGSTNSSPSNLTNFNGTLYFSANDGNSGTELWKSDGTAVGTFLVKDIWAGSTSSTPSNLTNVNGTLYFTASNGTNGSELWKSDGTAAGTVLVNDIWAGSTSSFMSYLTNVNGTLYFRAENGTNGAELWKSDGTATGTVLVKDIYAGSTGSSLSYLTNVNGTLYFAANDGTNGRELWKSDGTAAGTVLVKDIVAGSSSSSPTYLTNVNGTLYFPADDGTNGTELWKSDGTAAGTILVKDIYPGSSSSIPHNLTNVNGTLYFVAYDPVYGPELLKSDGTAAGTVLVKDIKVGSLTSSPTNLTNVDGTLYFNANDGSHGIELWKSDGTEKGTVLVSDIFAGSGSSSPSNPTNVDGTVYLTANNGTNGNELWKLDKIDNQTTNEDTPTSPIPLTIGDLETNASALTVTGSSSNTTLLPNSNIVFAGSGANRTVTLTPAANQSGNATIAISVSDGTTNTLKTLNLTVNPVNDAPTVANAIANQSATTSSPFSFTFDTNTFNDVDAGDSLTYTATRSDGTALPTWLSFNAASRTISGTPTNEDVGTLSIKVQATDTAGASDSDIFDLAIATANNAPTDILLSGTSINENSPVGTLIGNLSTSDLDAGDTHTYQFNLGNGSFSTVNGPFQIVGSQLQVNGSLDYETQSSYTLTIRTIDASSAVFDKSFTIAINNLDNIINVADETFAATAEKDVIDAASGNDTITTTLANLQPLDALKGGEGTDTFVLTGGSTLDVLRLNLSNPNQLSSINGASVPNISLTNFENVELSNFAGSANITGSSQANSLTGGYGNDALYGGSGNDTLLGSTGNDTLDSGLGDDNLQGGIGNDTITTTFASLQPLDTFNGGEGTDRFVLAGGSASDTLMLNLSNANQLEGILGASLSDFEHVNLRNFAGSAGITGNSIANTLNGGAGNDTVDGAEGNDTLYGYAGNDSLIGGAGNDSLVGDFGSDNLTGGIGDDILYLGSDTTTDKVNYASGDGTDTLYQFVRGVSGDKISFTGFDHIRVVGK